MPPKHLHPGYYPHPPASSYYYPNPFHYGVNNQTYYYNGTFYPYDDTTTTTSTTPRYGNVYAFFFRQGNTETTETSGDALVPFEQVEESLQEEGIGVEKIFGGN